MSFDRWVVLVGGRAAGNTKAADPLSGSAALEVPVDELGLM
jgi:hypothetical protein